MVEKPLLISIGALIVALVALAVILVELPPKPVELPVEMEARIKTLEDRFEAVSEELTRKIEGPIYTGQSIGYVITFENGKRLYISGDSYVFGDMKDVIKELFSPDVALLACGGMFTMDFEAAALATTWLDPEYAICTHYGTFPVLDGWTGDPSNPDVSGFIEKLAEYKEKALTRAEVLPMKPGEEIELYGIKIKWIGHGTFLITSVKGTTIMVDPWLETNLASPIKSVDELPKIDIILLTHMHLDHYSPAEFREIIRRDNSLVIAEWDAGEFISFTHPGTKLVNANRGAHITYEKAKGFGIDHEPLKGITISIVHALHTSSPPFVLWKELVKE